VQTRWHVSVNRHHALTDVADIRRLASPLISPRLHAVQPGRVGRYLETSGRPGLPLPSCCQLDRPRGQWIRRCKSYWSITDSLAVAFLGDFGFSDAPLQVFNAKLSKCQLAHYLTECSSPLWSHLRFLYDRTQLTGKPALIAYCLQCMLSLVIFAGLIVRKKRACEPRNPSYRL